MSATPTELQTMSVKFHQQKAGQPWRSMMVRLLRLRTGATAWHDYAVIHLQIGHWHKSLEVGWTGYVHGFRLLPRRARKEHPR